MADPNFVELTPEVRERLVKYQDEHEGEPLGNVGSRVLFEDEKVRIWELRLEPGEASDLHRHECDYYLVMLQGDLIAGVPPKGSGIEPYAAQLPPGGTTVSIPKGETEWAINVGEDTFYEILIELKD